MRTTKRLADHGVIGDNGRAAIVANNGAIVWYSPRGVAESPSCYSLLDERNGGQIRLGPSRPDWTGTQEVANDETPTLTTRFDTADGAIEVVDHLDGDRITRVLTIVRGHADVTCSVAPAVNFGSPWRVERWSNGIAYGHLRIEGMQTDVVETLHAGERRVVTISSLNDLGVTRLAVDRPHPTFGEAMTERDNVHRRWRSDVGSIDIDSALRRAVLRSARALRLLSTGTGPTSVQRALTTSLPARTGNERNIDERFAWIRDNAQAVRVWDRLDRRKLAAQHRHWLHDRADDALPFSPMYRHDGERPRVEEELALPGWLGNGPVRVGHRGSTLLDLGAHAELSLVLDDRDSWQRLERLADWIAEHWSKPDASRWDSRARPRRHVESAIACGIALDALIATARRRNPVDPVALPWIGAQREIDAWLRIEGHFGVGESAGWRRVGGDLADDTSDAALFRWLRTDTLPSLRDDLPNEPEHRVDVTLDQSLAQLTEWPFVHRHLPHVDDGFPPGQGADLWASFTMVSVLARQQRWDEAHARMDALVETMGATHVGATHVDPMTGDLRGNLCAAPTHLALIEAALDLARGPR